MLEEFAIYTMGLTTLLACILIIALGGLVICNMMWCIETGIPSFIFWIKSKISKDKKDDTEGTE